MKKLLHATFRIAMPAVLLLSCTRHKDDTADRTDNVSATMVLTWNAAGLTAVQRMGALPPMPESRIDAAVNIAMHDALNNIVSLYDTYAYAGIAVPDANADAAVAQAAHDVLVSFLPPQKAFADSLLTVSLAGIPSGADKELGITTGKGAAAALISKRMNDGAATAQIPYANGSLPGEYRYTPPFDAPGAAFVAVAGWGNVKPFSLVSSSQFRPGAPYTLTGNAYATDYNEIKKLGCLNCPDRTPDQKEIGLFWLENVPTSVNRIAVTLINKNHLNAWKAARLLALLQMAEADANIACFDAKFLYKFWRPITAVRSGESDGNAQTTGDAAWIILSPPTPPVPDYPSNHAADGGAGTEVIRRYFNTDDIAFSTTSTFLPGITRNFTKLSQASREIALSRIYVGYHFRNAVDSGEVMGKKIGQYVFEHSLKSR
jgi:hypothetical protein